jgi:hypothetical protein
MKTKTMNCMFAATLVACSLGAMGAAHADPKTTLVVVISDKSKVDDLSSATLRRIFQSEPTETGDGGRYIPLNYAPGSPPRILFDKVILKLEPTEVSQFWIDQQIRGSGKAPRTIPDPKLLVQLIPKLPGAIAYVPADQVMPGVKVVKIDGKKPGEAGYPLP